MNRTFAALAGAAALALLALPAHAFGPQEFSAERLRIEGVIGKLDVKVTSGGRVSVAVTGPQEPLSRVSVTNSGDAVVVKQAPPPRNSRIDEDDYITVTVSVPAGTGLAIDDFIGEGVVGDLNGPLAVEDLTSGNLKVGRVTTATVEISGSGDLVLGDVERDLSIGIDGSGNVTTGRTTGKTSLEINGSGEIEVASVEGPVSAEINGSGDIVIKGGTADPLAVSIAGSGDIQLDGVATSQTISQSGSGNVRIGKAK